MLRSFVPLVFACSIFFKSSCILTAQDFDAPIESDAPSADFMIAYFDDFGVLVAAEVRDVGYVPLDKLSASFRAFLSDEVSPSGTGTGQAYDGWPAWDLDRRQFRQIPQLLRRRAGNGSLLTYPSENFPAIGIILEPGKD